MSDPGWDPVAVARIMRNPAHDVTAEERRRQVAAITAAGNPWHDEQGLFAPVGQGSQSGGTATATHDPRPYELKRGSPMSGRQLPYDPQQRAAAEAELRALADNALARSVKLAMTEAGLKGLIRDGRFKTVHERVPSSREKVHGTTAYKNRDTYLENRRAYEDRVMGIPPTSDSKKPVYGMVDDKVAPNYGEYTVVLKDRVKGRTTTTFGDSLDGTLRPLWRDELATASAKDLAAATDSTYVPYTEQQVHGGVVLDDIATIVMTPASFRKMNGENYPERYIKPLEDAGIRIVVSPASERRKALEDDGR